MKVSTEWRGHAHDLRRIAEALKGRPVVDADEDIESLHAMAEKLDVEAAVFAKYHEAE